MFDNFDHTLTNYVYRKWNPRPFLLSNVSHNALRVAGALNHRYDMRNFRDIEAQQVWTHKLMNEQPVKEGKGVNTVVIDEAQHMTRRHYEAWLKLAGQKAKDLLL
jgi:hypothetical protein